MATMMGNRRRQHIERSSIAILHVLLVALAISWPRGSHAHYIHIDHNEFRAHGFPRPPLPPPLPPMDQLPQHLSAKELTPAEFMVDLSNDLTYRIMHYHSILNRNNFAFSPTALMSVLVALYEGSTARSALEMRKVLQLPGNRDIIRVGYRDIHRRLRTYFFGSENPLKGLSLNKDNVTITREYETVLMFYGYDLGMDMVSSTVTPSTTAMPTAEDTTMPPTTAMPTESPTTAVPTTPPTTTTTTPPATTTTTAAPTTTTTAPTTTTTAPKTTTAPSMTTSEVAESKETRVETTTSGVLNTVKPTIATTTESMIESTTEEAATTAAMTTTAATTTITESPTTEPVTTPDVEIKSDDEAAELISSFVAEEDAEPFLRIQKARVSRLPSGKLQAPLPSTAPIGNYLPSTRTSGASVRLSRSKRHLFEFKELDASLYVTLLHPQPPHHNLFPVSGPGSGSLVAELHNEFDVDVEPHFIRGTETKQNYNTDIISHVFYLSNQQIIHTTFKVYNAVLYYKYFENLKMSVLELELDTPEYNLMILLPDFNVDLVTAAASLRVGPTLRIMRKELKPRWVQAIIPDFKLHGTMYLTNDLQNMGICDIFEPNRADFRPMTDEKGIYVKHIEQSINVNIRTRPINQLKRNSGQQAQPIQISVNHPFLFFIIDRDLDVAVMAGRVLNPLNVRIQ